MLDTQTNPIPVICGGLSVGTDISSVTIFQKNGQFEKFSNLKSQKLPKVFGQNKQSPVNEWICPVKVS